jgi:4-amino-4-deoxy-L-arabinose transferase-like glycosyltransferase
VECLLTSAAALVLHLLFDAPYPTGWDDVDFALALDQYDISRMQPHFPGYPLYILAGYAAHIWYRDPFAALSFLSAISGALAIIPLWLLCRSWGSIWTARMVTWLYIVSPLPWISAVQPTSDAMGACLALWLAYWSWKAADPSQRDKNRMAALIAAGLTLGLLLGVRISYLALSALWVWAALSILRGPSASRHAKIRAVVWSAASALSVCVIWLTAMVISVGGAGAFIQLAFSFTEGHFSDWGGAYHSDASLINRAGLLFIRQIGAAGLGTVWTDAGGLRWLPTLFACLGMIGALSAFISRFSRFKREMKQQGLRKFIANADSRLIFLIIWVVPYLCWAFFAQNAEKPRHILPLLPPVIYTIIWGIDKAAAFRLGWRGRLYAVIGVVGFMGTFAVSYPLLQEAHEQRSPMVQLAEYVRDHIPSTNSVLFTWEEQRVISYYSPQYTVIRLRKWNDFRMELLQYTKLPANIYATNAFVDGMDRPVSSLFEEKAVFKGSPWLYPTYHTITLYQGNEALMNALRTGKEE